MNQTAQYLASKGRNGDTMLVHMSPKEVGGLQTLARNNGTSLTINPQTGLPEAFNLGRLLPMVAGFALGPAGLGLSALQAGLITGGLGALATGSLKEGLMMGLGAAGGAGLAGSAANLAAPAAPAAAAAPTAGSVVGVPSAMSGAGSGLTVPVSALNTSATSPALLNAGPVGNVGLTSKSMALPSLEGTSAGLNTVGTAPINYGFVPDATGTTGLASLPSSVNSANAAFGSGASSTLVSPTASLTPNAAAPVTTDTLSNVGLKVQPFKPVSTIEGGITQAQAQQAGVYGPGYNPNISAESQFYMKTPPDYSMAGGAPKVTELSAPLTTAEKMGQNYARFKEGAGSLDSMEKVGDFLGSNKMNLAMSAAPLLIPEEEEPIEARQAYIRPYTLDIDNTSDIAASPVGREDQRLRYRYTAGTPYKAAQGGIIAFAEGGNTTDGQEIGSNPLSPEAASVYQSIARIQGQAGLPQIDLSTMPMGQPSPVERLNTMSMPAAQPQIYQPIDYQVPMPKYTDSTTYNEMQKAGGLGMLSKLLRGMGNVAYPEGYAEGGQPRYRDVRKKIDRMADPYAFTGYQRGEGLYESAEKNFAAGGGLSGVPRFLSGGGDGMSDSIPATINGRQPARLADGEFVIPADVVSHLGNGSSKAGAKQLYAMMDRVRNKRTGKKKQAPAVNPKRMMPA